MVEHTDIRKVQFSRLLDFKNLLGIEIYRINTDIKAAKKIKCKECFDKLIKDQRRILRKLMQRMEHLDYEINLRTRFLSREGLIQNKTVVEENGQEN